MARCEEVPNTNHYEEVPSMNHYEEVPDMNHYDLIQEALQEVLTKVKVTTQTLTQPQ